MIVETIHSPPGIREIVGDHLGLRELRRDELAHIVVDFQRQMETGRCGNSESLAMLSTPFEPRPEKLSPNETIVSMDLGGTWLRTGIVGTNDEGVLLPPERTAKEPIKRVYSSFEAFIDVLFDEVKPLLEDFSQDDIGFIFSFPFDTEKWRGNIDGIVIKLTKGWEIPGIVNQLVGKALLEKINDEGLGERKIAVLNDTIGTCLSIEGARVGGVVATGTNFTEEENDRLYNIESGNYDGVPQTRVSQKVDELLEEIGVSRGTQLAEKQIAGDPLAWSLHAAFLLLGEEGIVRDDIASAIRQRIEEESFSAAQMSLVLSEKKEKWQELEENLGVELTEEEKAFCYTTCDLLRKRSTQIVGTMVAAILNRKGLGLEAGPEAVEKIPIEGSVFWKMPEYKALVEETVNELLPERNYEFVTAGEHAGLIGAAVAALTSLRQ